MLNELFEFFHDAFVNFIAEVFDGGVSISQHDRCVVVWKLSLWLGVTKHNNNIPYLFLQDMLLNVTSRVLLTNIRVRAR